MADTQGDMAEITRALAVLFYPGQVTELRALNASTPDWRKPHTVSGYFDQANALTQAAAQLTRSASGVYVVVNPILPDLLSRAANRVRNVGQHDPLTSDTDITGRRWLLVDYDPKRPTGISASEAEHAAALARAQEIREWLTARGWPAPVSADSGNGGHLLYAVDLPNDADSTALLQAVLESLDFQFSDERGKVDATVYNAARIWKLYGTWARKGDNTPARPHRLSRLLDVPATIETVSTELLQALADMRPKAPPAPTPRPGAPGQAWDLTRWVSDHRLDVFDPVPYQGKAKKWVFRACPFNAAHTDRSAVLIEWPSGAAYFRCQHDGCTGKTWRDLRALYEPDRGESPAQVNTQGAPSAPVNDPPAQAAPSPTFNTTDQGNGERLVARYGRDLRYCHTWGKWLVWDGRRWAVDDTAEVERRAKTTIRAIYSEAAAVVGDDEASKAQRRALAGWAGKSESRGKLEAMIKQAASEPGIAVAPDDLDADPWLLNVANGTLDLRTGQLRPHNRADLLTKLCPVEYHPNAAAPTWAAFLTRIMDNKPELVTFLQRAIGYSLTGSIRERFFVIAYGQGDNGKTTLLETVQVLLGDYASRTPTETLMVRRDGNIPNDLARLKGARFVFASEAEQGRRLAVSLVKDMTGGDTITARFMRAEFFEFKPEFKLWLATNHRPVIKDTNKAIWRRIRLVPFAVSIPEAEQDKKLPEKLLAELTGILAWAVAGCLAWQRDGLEAPAEVKQATAAYRADSDDLAAWLAECCHVAPDATARSEEARKSFMAFVGEEKLSKNTFAGMLRDRGFADQRTKAGTVWHGFGLLATEPPAQPSLLPKVATNGLVATSDDDSGMSNRNMTHESVIPDSLQPLPPMPPLQPTEARPRCSECDRPAIRETRRGWLCEECIEFHAGLGGEL